MTKTMNKAIKAATLAISAESLDNHGECTAAANRAGQLAFSAGMTLDNLVEAVPGICAAGLTWNTVVDAWYEAKEAVGEAFRVLFTE